MTNVVVLIDPPLPGEESSDVADADGILSQDEFAGKDIACVVSILLDNISISYGRCNLSDYYLDFVEELDKLNLGFPHNFDMSGYTVASVSAPEQGKVKITVYNAVGDTPVEEVCILGLQALITELEQAKVAIERFIRMHVKES